MTETCQILDYFLKFVPLVNNFTRQRVETCNAMCTATCTMMATCWVVRNKTNLFFYETRQNAVRIMADFNLAKMVDLNCRCTVVFFKVFFMSITCSIEIKNRIMNFNYRFDHFRLSVNELWACNFFVYLFVLL